MQVRDPEDADVVIYYDVTPPAKGCVSVREGVCVVRSAGVSNAAAVISVVLMQTLAGLGVLAAIGLVSTLAIFGATWRSRRSRGWPGPVSSAATLATFGSRLSASGWRP